MANIKTPLCSLTTSRQPHSVPALAGAAAFSDKALLSTSTVKNRCFPTPDGYHQAGGPASNSPHRSGSVHTKGASPTTEAHLPKR